MGINEILVITMVLTLVGLLMSGFPVAFTLGGTALIFGTIGAFVDPTAMRVMGLLPIRIFDNIVRNELLFAIPAFIVMGTVLEKSRIAEDLLVNMARLFGRIPGGLAYSVTIVGALLAASTGIVGATVVTMGLLSLPAMMKRGYDPALATGSISAAGTLGQIIPPSIVLILLTEVMSNSWSIAQEKMGIFSPSPLTSAQVFAGALMPGLLLVLVYLGYQAYIAFSDPAKAPAITSDDDEDHVKLLDLLGALVPPLLLIIAVLGSILGGLAGPTEAASVGAIGAILLAAARRLESGTKYALVTLAPMIFALLAASGMDIRGGAESAGFLYYVIVGAVGLFFAGLAYLIRALYREGILAPALQSSLRVSTMIFSILIGAALFALVFRGLGGDHMVSHILGSIGGGFWSAMLLVMLVIFVLGFFLDFIEITFIVVPLVAPPLLAMEGSPGPVWLAVMIAMNLQTSFLTPPFGFALFYLRGVLPKDVPTSALYKGAIPFVVLQVAMLLMLSLFPELVTWLGA